MIKKKKKKKILKRNCMKKYKNKFLTVPRKNHKFQWEKKVVYITLYN